MNSKFQIDKSLVLSVIDHTRLNENDSLTDILKWLNVTKNYVNDIAAICVYPKFLKLINDIVKNTSAKTATVINFPNGNDSYNKIIKDVMYCINNNVDELDIVVDFHEYNKFGHSPNTITFLQKTRELAEDKILKVIIECGEIKNKNLLLTILKDVTSCKINFVKTSTGKNKLWNDKDLKIIVNYLKNYNKHNENKVGLKISGGISTFEQAHKYIEYISTNLGQDFIDKKHFRIGSSRLLNNIKN